MWLLRVLVAAILLAAHTVPGWYTSRSCSGCYRCTGIRCRRRLDLLEYLEHSGYGLISTNTNERESHSRHLQSTTNSTTSPSISCTKENELCQAPYTQYCCSKQSDGGLTCGLGVGWANCTLSDGSSSADRCDFDFGCSGGLCCGYQNGIVTGPGWCGRGSLCSNLLVACNPLGPINSGKTQSAVDPVSGETKVQHNDQFCSGGNRGNGRCKAPTNCCSASGFCDLTAANCKTDNSQFVWKGGGNGVAPNWVLEEGSVSVVYCGGGKVGNGACKKGSLEGSATFGVVCCSTNGYCGTTGTDPLGAQFCEGETFNCLCPNGLSATGDSPRCEKCISCNEGFGFSLISTCIGPTVTTCPKGEFITSLTVRSHLWMDAITSFQCSGGRSVIKVDDGGTGGGPATATDAEGFCSISSGLYAGYVTKVTLRSCVSGRDSDTFGSYGTSSSTASCTSRGQKIVGLKTVWGNSGSYDGYFLTYLDIVCGPTTSDACPTDIIGYVDADRGFYDIQCRGIAADYCRNRGNIKQYFGAGSSDNWFACKLAGRCSDPDSARGVYTVAEVRDTETWCAVHCNVGDLGYVDSDRGYFDVQCQGAPWDYCRNVGNYYFGAGDARNWFSCKLSGHCDVEYSLPGVYTAAKVRDTATWCAVNRCSCRNGVAGTGSTRSCTTCTSCYQGYYLTSKACVACPTGFSAPAGSVGSAACVVPSDGILGCFHDCGTSPSNIIREMPDMITDPFNTYELCAKRCYGYTKYFGVENGSECYCGDFYANQGASNNCNAHCPGYSSSSKKVCGGACALTAGIVSKFVCGSDFYKELSGNCKACPSGFSSPVGSTSLANCKAITSDGMVAGCYKDCGSNTPATGVRDLRVQQPDSIFNTRSSCAWRCSGYKFFGVQNGNLCFCGNSYGSQNFATNCNIACTGSSADLCGGSCANQIGISNVVKVAACECLNGVSGPTTLGCLCISCYAGYYLTSSKNCHRCAQGLTAPAGSVGSTYCTVPQNGILGCYRDCAGDPPIRDMPTPLFSSKSMSYTYCAQHCSGFKYFGVQAGSLCFCSDVYGSQGFSTSCNTACVADASQICGGNCANTIGIVAKSVSLCSCAHGISGTGAAGCVMCSSCNAGFAFSPISTCIAPTAFTCTTAGTFITQITVWSGNHLDKVASFTCSDNSLVTLNAGESFGSKAVATSGDGQTSSSGYCAVSTDLYLGYALQLKLTECGTGIIDGPFGLYLGSTRTTQCTGQQKVLGLQITVGQPAASSAGVIVTYFDIICGTVCSCLYGSSVLGSCSCASCFEGYYLDSGTCKACPLDKSSPAGSVGLGACSLPKNGILGCFRDNTNAVRDLPVLGGYLISSNSYAGCGQRCTGYKYFGVEFGVECYCGDKYGAQGISSYCNMACPGSASQICGGVNAITIGLVLSYAPKTFTCASAGKYITQITLYSGDWIDGIVSFKCSDQSIVTLNAGGSGSSKKLATSGDGGSFSPGYCSFSLLSNGENVSQLRLAECGNGSSDGPFGIHAYSTESYGSCYGQSKALGIKVETSISGTYIKSFDIICDTVPSKDHTLVIKMAAGPDTYLNLMEVRINGGANLAATLSNTLSSSYPASNCIDGNISTMCQSGSPGASLTITFTGTVSSIVVMNRIDAGQAGEDRIIGAFMYLDGTRLYKFSSGTPAYTVHTLVIKTSGESSTYLNLMEVSITGGSTQAATLTDIWSPGNPASNCIDGNLSTMCQSGSVGASLTIYFTGTASSILVTNRIDAGPAGENRICGAIMYLDGIRVYKFPPAPGVPTYMVTAAMFSATSLFAGLVPVNNTAGNSTAVPSTVPPSTLLPTVGSSTLMPASANHTTVIPASLNTTTVQPSTIAPSTLLPTTANITTVMPSPANTTTMMPTLGSNTMPPTSANSTASSPSAIAPSTLLPTTANATSEMPTTLKPSGTLVPTTVHVTPTVANTTTLTPTIASPADVIPTITNVTTIKPAHTAAPSTTVSNSTTVMPSVANITTLQPSVIDPLTTMPSAVNVTSTAAPTTLVPSTLAPTIPEISTSSPTSLTPVTVDPSTLTPSTVTPTTPVPSTLDAISPAPSTAFPSTLTPTPSTAGPSTVKPSTATPTTPEPSTSFPTTVKPSTVVPSTAGPSTVKPSTVTPATLVPSTVAPTVQPTTAIPTTMEPSTSFPTIVKPSTSSPNPSTDSPTQNNAHPTSTPSRALTSSPTDHPSSAPTNEPSSSPTESPTQEPTASPTESPTVTITKKPTSTPTEHPTSVPTEVPTSAVTESPTEVPTKEHTSSPTERPTSVPTKEPTYSPTDSPTQEHTSSPTSSPTHAAVDYKCSSGFVIDTITLRSDTSLNAITSFVCKDSSGTSKTKTVNVGDSSAGTSATVTGPFTAFSSGYALSPDPTDGASGLSFIKVDGSTVPSDPLSPYGTSYTDVTTQTCGSGQVLYGFSLATDISGTMVGGNMKARCRVALTPVPSTAPTALTDSLTSSPVEHPAPAEAPTPAPADDHTSSPADDQTPAPAA